MTEIIHWNEEPKAQIATYPNAKLFTSYYQKLLIFEDDYFSETEEKYYVLDYDMNLVESGVVKEQDFKNYCKYDDEKQFNNPNEQVVKLEIHSHIYSEKYHKFFSNKQNFQEFSDLELKLDKEVFVGNYRLSICLNKNSNGYYIWENVQTKKVISMVYDTDRSLQPGDSDSNIFLVKGKHIAICNDGDVSSVIIFKLDGFESKLSVLCGEERLKFSYFSHFMLTGMGENVGFVGTYDNEDAVCFDKDLNIVEEHLEECDWVYLFEPNDFDNNYDNGQLLLSQTIYATTYFQENVTNYEDFPFDINKKEIWRCHFDKYVLGFYGKNTYVLSDLAKNKIIMSATFPITFAKLHLVKIHLVQGKHLLIRNFGQINSMIIIQNVC